jgi:hypothetical protein
VTWRSDASDESWSSSPSRVPGPLVGWRAWRVTAERDGLALRSAVFDEVWQPGLPLAASCPHGHVAPAPACGCGIYAVRAPAAAVRYLVGRDDPAVIHRVLGRVALWGVTIEADAGWRAQYAEPLGLIVPAGRTNGWPVAAAGVAAALAAAYALRADVLDAAEPRLLARALAA